MTADGRQDETAEIVAAVAEMNRERRKRTADLIAELERDDDDLDDLLESIDEKRERTTALLEQLSGGDDA